MDKFCGTESDSERLTSERNNNDDSNADKENGNKVSALKIIKNHPAYFHQAHAEIGILHMLNTRCDPTGEKKIVKLLDQFVRHNHLCLVFNCWISTCTILTEEQIQRGLVASAERAHGATVERFGRVERGERDSLRHKTREHSVEVACRPREVKLVDFGSAHFQNRTVYQYIQSRFYRSPEVSLGTPYGMLIDMWSLGLCSGGNVSRIADFTRLRRV